MVSRCVFFLTLQRHHASSTSDLRRPSAFFGEPVAVSESSFLLASKSLSLCFLWSHYSDPGSSGERPHAESQWNGGREPRGLEQDSGFFPEEYLGISVSSKWPVAFPLQRGLDVPVDLSLQEGR